VVVKINCGHESFIWSLIKLELVRSEDFVFNCAIQSVYGQGDDDFKYFLSNLALYSNQSTFAPSRNYVQIWSLGLAPESKDLNMFSSALSKWPAHLIKV
jgi:hypothetical protein